MPPGRLSSVLANLSKQKMIPATVIDVLGKKCSVRVSGTGAKLTAIDYFGLQPSIGDTVHIDYRGTSSPIALTTTDSIPADFPRTEKKKVLVTPVQFSSVITMPVDGSVEYTMTIQNANTKVIKSVESSSWEYRQCTPWTALYDVIWVAEHSQFVAVGDGWDHNGAVQTSPDGIIWTSRSCPQYKWRSIAYSASLNLYVAVAWYYNCIMTSPDGVDWSLLGVVGGREAGLDGGWNRVLWVADLGKFIAIGDGHEFDGPGQGEYDFSLSSDGVTWTNHKSGAGLSFGQRWYDAAWSSALGRLVAVGNDFEKTSRTMLSSDGLNWVPAVFPDSTVAVSSISVSNVSGDFLVVGARGSDGCATFFSRDGLSWQASNFPSQADDTYASDVLWIPEMDSFAVLTQDSHYFLTTTQDGAAWRYSPTTPVTGKKMWALAWSPELSRVVVVGEDRIMTGQC